MKRQNWIVFLVAVAVVGCESVVEPGSIGSESSSDAIFASPQGVAKHGGDHRLGNFVASLSGGEEVPPVDTGATGVGIFHLNEAGDELHYKLIVANIVDVLMSHIHVAPPGENGGVVVWLYPDGPPPQLIEGRTDGPLAEGVITAADLVGDLEGLDLSALLDAIRAGNTYVNVHTSANPGGEIRGQIDVGNDFPR